MMSYSHTLSRAAALHHDAVVIFTMCNETVICILGWFPPNLG